jgi:hypothetical protein
MPYPSKTDRNSILLAAVEEISHSGIRHLSLRNLASLLGLAPTALYRYFSNRAELELLSPTNAHGDLKMCSGCLLRSRCNRGAPAYFSQAEPLDIHDRTGSFVVWRYQGA